VLAGLLGTLLLCLACNSEDSSPPESHSEDSSPPESHSEDPLQRLTATEDLLIELSRELGRIEEDLSAGILPGPNTEALFTAGSVATSLTRSTTVKGQWQPLSSEVSTKGIWTALVLTLGNAPRIDAELLSVTIYGPTTSSAATSVLKIQGSGRNTSGQIHEITARARLSWVRDGTSWKILRWDSLSGSSGSTDRPLFREVLEEHMAPELVSYVRRSEHEEKVKAALTQPDFSSPSHFQFEAFDRHPGLAVADIDGDGRDELFLASRQGKNVVLHDDGSGQYSDVAEAWGLDSSLATNAALFVDLDNDGDLDAVLAHWAEPSQILEQVNGVFRARDVPGLPALVSSISAADVDGDGLLDLHFATYAASAIEQLQEFWTITKAPASPALGPFLPKSDAKELGERLRSPDEHFFYARSGPPNVLLQNQGDLRFDDTSEAAGLALFRNTYQAGFADVDADGDPDLYLANDFASNHLLRNDAGKFTEIPLQSGASELGLGMGVSWGDVDRDGVLDLYVSNMDSKAGRRITGALRALDPRIAQAAQGGQLLMGDGEGLIVAGGPAPHHVRPSQAGWSWGGSFADFDNDGWLDLYVPNGYYSSPADREGVGDS